MLIIIIIIDHLNLLNSEHFPNCINLLQNLFKVLFLKIFASNSNQCTESFNNHDFFIFGFVGFSYKIKTHYFLPILFCVGKWIQES